MILFVLVFGYLHKIMSMYSLFWGPHCTDRLAFGVTLLQRNWKINALIKHLDYECLLEVDANCCVVASIVYVLPMWNWICAPGVQPIANFLLNYPSNFLCQLKRYIDCLAIVIALKSMHALRVIVQNVKVHGMCQWCHA